MKKFIFTLFFILVFIYNYIDAYAYSDEYNYINSNTAILANRLATSQLLADGIIQGIDNISIDNQENLSVDQYLDNLYDTIMSNPDSLVISGAYGINQLKQSLNNKCIDLFNWISDITDNFFDSLSITPSLNDFFDWLDTNNISSKTNLSSILNVGNTLFKLGLNNNENQVSPDPDFSFLSNINNLYLITSNQYIDFLSTNIFRIFTTNYSSVQNIESYSFYCPDPGQQVSYTLIHVLPQDLSNLWRHAHGYYSSTIITIYCYTQLDGSVICSYSVPTWVNYNQLVNASIYNGGYYGVDFVLSDGYKYMNTPWDSQNYPNVTFRTSYPSKSVCFNDIYSKFFNVNIYVDDVPWVLTNQVNLPTTTHIGQQTIINQYNYPVEYFFPEDTQIDYNKLYEVIKKAVDDGDDLNITTINEGNIYYDSHDSNITPDINIDIGDLDQSLLDTFIKYAAIPNFNTYMLEPLTAQAENMATVSEVATSVIPEDIIVIFGGIFGIVIFCALIHRLIE